MLSKKEEDSNSVTVPKSDIISTPRAKLENTAIDDYASHQDAVGASGSKRNSARQVKSGRESVSSSFASKSNGPAEKAAIIIKGIDDDSA